MTSKLEIKKKDYTESNIPIDRFVSNIPYNEYSKDYKTCTECIEKFNDYHIKGKLRINSELHDSDFMYFVYKNKLEYIAFDLIHPDLWYRVENNIMAEEIMVIYNNKTYKKAKEFSSSIRAYIGSYETLNMTFNGIARYVLLNKFTEKILWNEDIEYNKKGNMKDLSTLDLACVMTNTIDDDIQHLCFYTKYSKSLIKIENYNNSFIVDIKYNGIMNKNISALKSDAKNYPNNLPVDVVTIFANFAFFITFDDIFANPKNITMEHLKLSALLTDTVEDMENLKLKITDAYDSLDDAIKDYAKTMMVKLNLNIKLDKLEKNGFFDKFSSHMSELISNAYDQFESSNNGEKMEDIALTKDCANELLKYKMNDIISKLFPY